MAVGVACGSIATLQTQIIRGNWCYPRPTRNTQIFLWGLGAEIARWNTSWKCIWLRYHKFIAHDVVNCMLCGGVVLYEDNLKLSSVGQAAGERADSLMWSSAWFPKHIASIASWATEFIAAASQFMPPCVCVPCDLLLFLKNSAGMRRHIGFN